MDISTSIFPNEELNNTVLNKFPYPIAVNYKRLITADTWKERVDFGIKLFEFGLRLLSVTLLSKYLITDVDRVKDKALDNYLLKTLQRNISLGTWNEILFRILQVYERKRNLFFMPELYDFYWDTSITPIRPRKGVRKSFNRLVQIRNDTAHRLVPLTEEGLRPIAEEIISLLSEIFGQLSFLEKYELIRITEQKENGYAYEVYMGLEIKPGPKLLSLTASKNIQEGWFFFSKESGSRLLPMHPLLVFWAEEEQGSLVNDAALFDTFNPRTVQYMATVLWKVISSEEFVNDFIRLLFFDLKHVKLGKTRAKVSQFSWNLLRNTASQITQSRSQDIREKYDPELYLQRQDVKQAFDDFLQSDKTCFLLLGQSGVGKSNFMMSLLDAYQARVDLCFLVYNAAHLSYEKSLGQTIGQEFEQYLEFAQDIEDAAIQNIWAEIGRIEGIEERKFILVLDAINEHPGAGRFLRRVNELVADSMFPWLKIVISSRPQAWRTMQRGQVIPRSKYFRPPQSKIIGVELKKFELSEPVVEMSGFGFGEIEEAYGIYQRKYNLQSEFGNLSGRVKALLQDPLILRLISVTCENQQIPQTLPPQDLIEDYINHLLASGRMHNKDILFLKQEIVPRLVREGEFTNIIEPEQIAVALTQNGQQLSELIYNEERLSNGQRINQSFTNLVDAGILTLQGSGQNEGIAFKYERFYEHYLGWCLFETNVASADKLTAYRSMLQQIAGAPYAWGGIANALLRELLAGHNTLIQDLALALNIDQRESGVLLDAIVEFGEAKPEEVQQLLLNLINLRQKSLSVKRLAIEAASSLGYIEVLELAAKTRHRAVREIAILPIYSFWERDNDQGYVLLNRLAQDTSGRFKRPRLWLIEFLLQISLLIYANHIQHDFETLQPLLGLWRTVLGHFPWLISSKKYWGLPVNFIRKTMTRAALNIVSVGLEHNPAGEASKSIPGFFKWPPVDKKRAAYVARFMDVGFGEISTIKDDILYLALRGNGITHVITQGVLFMHLLANKENALSIVKYVNDSDESLWSRGAAAGSLYFFNISRAEVDIETFELLKVWTLEEWRSEDLFDPDSFVISVFIIESRLGLDRSDFVASLLDISSSFGHTRFVRDAVGIIAALKVVGLKGYPQYALNSLAYFLHIEDPKVQKALALTISRIGILYPDAVEYFRSLEVIPPALAYEIKRFSGTATAGEILGAYSWDALSGSVLVPEIRQTFINFVNEIISVDSMADAVELAIEKIIAAIQKDEATQD